MESQQIIALSFQKLNENKVHKNGDDLRRNLLVFTVISACQAEKKTNESTRAIEGRKRTNNKQDSDQPPSKQQLCSFENAFRRTSDVSEESGD